jgi:hypothetical protein
MRITIVAMLAMLAIGCTPSWEAQRIRYDSLGLRVSEMPKTMNYVWLGKEAFPPRVSTDEFMDSVRARLPKEYQLLSAYLIQYEGHGSYYLLKIFDRETRKMIMYDYSCSDSLDGPVYQDENKYSFEKRVVPSECRTQ